MTDLSVRLQCLARLVELLREEVDATVRNGTDVQVVDHDPGGEAFSESILVMDIRGNQDVDGLSGGIDMKTTDDFTITLVGLARKKKMTAVMARERVDEFYLAIRQVAYSSRYEHTLGDFTLANGHHPVAYTQITDVDGPISDPAGPEGQWGFVRVDFRIVTNEV